MNCEDARPQIEMYLDGELDGPAADALEAHLAACPACRARLASVEELRGALRALPRHHPPPELRARLSAASLPSMDATPVPRGASWRLAAAVLLGIAIGAGMMAWHSADRTADAGALLVRDLLASHLRALAANSAVDVVSEDRHTVKPWFAGKIGESPPVIDAQAEDFPLLGGRIDYVGDRRTAVVVYGHRRHVIDVYMTAGAAGAHASESQGFAITPCVLTGQSAWIVSDVDAESLRRFTRLLGCGT